MLVLTRKLHEQIRIGENITITILRIKGSGVRVGIEAPREVRVVRGELRPKGDEAAAVANGSGACVAVDDQGDAAAGDARGSDAVETTTVRGLAGPLPAAGLGDAGVVSYAV